MADYDEESRCPRCGRYRRMVRGHEADDFVPGPHTCPSSKGADRG